MTPDILDDEASALVAELDQRYQHFARALPDSFGWLASRSATYTAQPDDDAPFAGISHLAPGPVVLPLLLREMFAGADEEAFLQLTEAGAFFVLASILFDHLVDDQAHPRPEMLLFHAALYDHALSCCRSLLPPRSSFWPTFDRLGAAHRAGLALEQSVQAQPEQLTGETLEVIVGGKLAPCLLGVAGLSSLLDDPDRYRAADETLRHTALAAQHLDDALDWEDDLAHGRVTFLLARAGIGKMAGAEGEPPPTAISDRVQAGWLDVETIKLALAHYDRALDAAQDIPCPAWLAYLHHKRQSAHRILFQMTARRVVGLFDAVGSVEAQTASG